ncbi:tyrosine-type recombinase/integrase [Corynebacterium nuruki]|uniref:tyrosine-type recombinase/integrase n=1 Tax=Corynebacterium nuruki TaxID=1032851 RepID=UPI0039BF1ACE
MAEPIPYETKAGTRYKIKYRDPARESKTKGGFKTKRAAREWEAHNRVAMSRGEYRPADAGRVTVNDAGKAWLKSKVNISRNTRRAYEQALARIAKTSSIGKTYVRDVTKATVRAWVAAAVEDYAPKTVGNDHAVLHAVLVRAVDDGWIVKNPATGVDLPRVETEDITPMTPAQLRVMAESAGRHRPEVMVMGLAGLRWGEVVGLQVRDVVYEKGHIYVCRQKYESGGVWYDDLPKYGKKRFVPLTTELADELKDSTKGKDPDALVFTTRSGTPLQVRNARRDWFDAAVTAAGFEGYTPHQMRHTFASLAIRSGANPKTLQQAMGHSSAKVTLDTYGEWFPDDVQSLGSAMSRLLTEEWGTDGA